MPSDPNAPSSAREPQDAPTGAPASQSGDPTAHAPGAANPDATINATDETSDALEALAPAERPDELGRLGRYRVLRILGRGGMGVVFEAEDEKLKRRVALKAMLPALALSPAARRRFVREAEAAAKVEHDNIVPIYDIAESNGVPFLAMPLLIGTTLDDRLKAREPIPVPDLLVIGRHVAEGLTAAHAAGLIHRDIKPGNIWLETRADGSKPKVDARPEPVTDPSLSLPAVLSAPGSGASAAFPIPEPVRSGCVFRRARVLDFGLARSLLDTGVLTHSGAVIGTPAYMAPEQARGQTVDHRADLFSLGCVLYQMATGQRPFRGADTLAVLSALATDTPAPPAALNPSLPPALATLIERLLVKNPADRWPPTAQEVADELARIATAPPAAPVGVEDRTAPSRRRGRQIAALVTVVFVALVAVVYGVSSRRAREVPGDRVVSAEDPKPPPTKPQPEPPKIEPPTPAEQRKALEWARDAGATLLLRADQQFVTVTKGVPLPPGEFTVTRIAFDGAKGLTDATAENLKNLPPAAFALSLRGSGIGDAGFAKLAAHPWAATVTLLDLSDTAVTDAGCAHLPRFAGVGLLYPSL